MEAFGEDDHKVVLKEVEGDDDKYCTAVTEKSITQLSKEELEAKLECSKAKLRTSYQKTLPTRHSKVLEIDQIPNLKRSGQRMKKVASVPKRKLQQEARDYRSVAKETILIYKVKTDYSKDCEVNSRETCRIPK
ncbi:hypothetical protein V2J09_004530 [Rumex salicifolius]